jgi:prolyl oligopeptidase
VSRDGTSIPYFLIRPKSMKMDGSTPTLLNGYGGFQLPSVPNYGGTLGKLWLEQGNAFVVANIRGGGEFGPPWHQAAQGANKQRTWDDFIAVAEDLVKRRVTSPRRLGVVGGSQGGLLVGHCHHPAPRSVQRRHRAGALVRHAALPEAGRGRVVDRRIWRSRQARAKGVDRGLFALPEADGRADLPDAFLPDLDQGRPGPSGAWAQGGGAHGGDRSALLLYENVDGGHSAAANLKESARRAALEYTYATRQLVD